MTRIQFDRKSKIELEKIVKGLPSRFDEAIQIALDRIGDELQEDSRRLAPVKSGTLRRSITKQLFNKKVIVGTNLVYARILDQGGVIPAHTIEPVNKSVLRFVTKSGKVVFTKRVQKPAQNRKPYRGKGYMTPAFNKIVRSRALKIFEQEIEAVL